MHHSFDTSAGLDMQLLQILSDAPGGIGIRQIRDQLLTLSAHLIPEDTIWAQLNLLHGYGCADRCCEEDIPAPRCWTQWKLTPKGVAMIDVHFGIPRQPERITTASEDAFAEAAKEATQTQATLCDAREPDPCDIAMLCVSEAELDDWWGDHDVEIKSALFCMWTLGSDRALARGIERESQGRKAVIA